MKLQSNGSGLSGQWTALRSVLQRAAQHEPGRLPQDIQGELASQQQALRSARDASLTELEQVRRTSCDTSAVGCPIERQRRIDVLSEQAAGQTLLLAGIAAAREDLFASRRMGRRANEWEQVLSAAAAHAAQALERLRVDASQGRALEDALRVLAQTGKALDAETAVDSSVAIALQLDVEQFSIFADEAFEQEAVRELGTLAAKAGGEVQAQRNMRPATQQDLMRLVREQLLLDPNLAVYGLRPLVQRVQDAESLRRQLQALGTDVSILMSAAERLGRDAANVGIARRRFGRGSDELDLAQRDLSAASAERARLERELGAVVGEFRQARCAFDALQGGLEDVERRAARLEAANASSISALRRQREHLAAQEQQLHLASRQVVAQTTKVNEARGSVRAATQVVNNAKAALASAQGELNAARSDQTRMAEQVAVRTAKVAELKREMEKTRAAIMDAQRRRQPDAALRERLQSLIKDHDTQQSAVGVFQRKQEEATRAATEASRRVNQASNNVQAAESGAVTAQRILRQAETTLSAAQSSVAHVQREIEGARRSVHDLQAALAEGERHVQRLCEERHQIVRDLQRVRARLEQLEEHRRGLSHAVERSDLEYQRADLALQRANAEVRSAQDELEQASRRADGTRQEMESALQRFNAALDVYNRSVTASSLPGPAKERLRLVTLAGGLLDSLGVSTEILRMALDAGQGPAVRAFFEQLVAGLREREQAATRAAIEDQRAQEAVVQARLEALLQAA